jgi:hypothetical protein
MRALSIRQPYAELIPSASSGQALRGIKTARAAIALDAHRGGTILHLRFGSRQWAAGRVWSDDLRVAAPPPPAWMIELAEQVRMMRQGWDVPVGPG